MKVIRIISDLFLIFLIISGSFINIPAHIMGGFGKYDIEAVPIFINDDLYGSDTLFLSSPDNELKVCIWTEKIGSDPGCPVYNISYKGNSIVKRSRLGLTVDGVDSTLCSGLKIYKNERSSVNGSIELVASDVDVIPEIYNQLIVSFKSIQDDNILLDIIFRAYNEGISFSYNVEKIDMKKSCTIRDEMTGFNISTTSICYTEYGVEDPYNKVQISSLKNKCELPLLIKEIDSGCWISISEAGLQDYSRAYLGPGSLMNGTIDTSIHSSVTKNLPFKTPWRMVIVSDSPSEMIEKGRICYSMCPENAIGDTRWIKPGKAFRDCSLTTNGSKSIIDFCSYHGLEYVHLDSGWYGMESSPSSNASTVFLSNLNLTEVIAYAKSKDIGVILYVNIRALTKQYREIFPLYKEWGIAGVKFGYVDGRSQAGINFVHKAVQEAAKNELIVDVHDNYRPTGMSRTYPNLLTQEGVGGNEQFPSARDNTILPFTRCVAGPTDYTPIFATKGTTTTMAHQLALPIVIFSPLQYIYWLGTPEKAGNSSINTLWDNIPTVWNDSLFIEGSPETHAVLARRSEDMWYVGAINGPQERLIKIQLDFLEMDSLYSTRMYRDPGNGSVEVLDFIVCSETEIIERVPKNSGLSIKISEIKGGPPQDMDSDDDGIIDIKDRFPCDPNEWNDTDSDGYGDNSDAFPDDPNEWNDNDLDGFGDNTDVFPDDPNEWNDTDSDGYGDNSDSFPDDPLEWIDSDGDGYGDNGDKFPNDPLEWNDTDEDGWGDNRDIFPEDSTEWNDTDMDGYGDNIDAFPNNSSEWLDSDQDGIGDNSDWYPFDPNQWLKDTDEDGYPDVNDTFPNDWYEWIDSDGDGYGDNGDKFPNDPMEWNDTDEDGWGDNRDIFPEDSTEWNDTDMDGYGDNIDAFPNNSSEWLDSDQDGIGDNSDWYPFDPNQWLKDTDEDGYPDVNDTFPDNPNEWFDSDGDGFGDNGDKFPNDPMEWNDSDEDGHGDNGDAFPFDPSASIDTDGDGYPDRWNEDNDESYSTTGLELDAYPNDPNKWKKNDNETNNPTILIVIVLIFLLIIGLGVFIYFRGRKGESNSIEE